MNDERVRELANDVDADCGGSYESAILAISTAISEVTAEQAKKIRALRREIERLRYSGLRFVFQAYDAYKRSKAAWKARAEKAEAALREREELDDKGGEDGD